MLIMMIVALYTSRLVLNILGVEDFGIYNLVGGIVVLFSFLNSSMATSTQRFLNYELGKNNEENVQKVFCTSVIIHFFLVLIIVILAETLGLWFLNSELNIPNNRLWAANVVYQFSVLTFCVNVIRIPYNAIIVAYERMTFYAYISVIEALLQMLIVYLLLISSMDKLSLYSGLLSCVAILIFVIYCCFCRKSFKTTKFIFIWDKSFLKQITSFSGWSLLGNGANVGVQQGLNILLNIFYGVSVISAVGVANQVSSAIYRFISNFSVAYQPQIVQLYAAEKQNELSNLIFKSSKFSYYLFLILSVPVFSFSTQILQLWLNEVPLYSSDFCRLIIVYLLLDSIAYPLWISIQATGKIKVYQIIMFGIIFINLPVAYIGLKYGYPPYSVWFIRVLLNIVAFIFRFWYLGKVMNFSIKEYLRKVVINIMLVSVISFPIPIYLANITTNTIEVILGVFFSIMFTSIVIYCIGFTKSEKCFVKNNILRMFKK